MFHKNMLFKFHVDNETKSIPLKSIRSIRRVYEGILRISTVDYVLHTISMPDGVIPEVLSYYDDWLWETDNGVKAVTFPVYSSISRLNLEDEE